MNYCKTDIGLINKPNCLEIDKISLEKELTCFINEWDSIVSEEINKILFNIGNNIKLIISDISPLGFLIGDILFVKTIGISNFTWLDQYEHLKINDYILEKFKYAYSKCNKFIFYPSTLDLKGINCDRINIGFICREINMDKVCYYK